MCFASGSLISTPAGPRPAEAISIGDLVSTVEGRAEKVVWVGRSRVSWAEQMANPRKRPVRIGQQALGPGSPERALMLSPQHRVLCRSSMTRRVAGQWESLVPALALTELSNVRLMPSLPGLEYVHIACERHVLMMVEGLAVESMLPGPIALQVMGTAEQNNLAEVLGWSEGHWGDMVPVRPILSMRKAEKLVARSQRSRMALVAPEVGSDADLVARSG
jgi:hypothetical protein